MKPDYKIIGTHLKKLREAEDLSYADVCDLAFPAEFISNFDDPEKMVERIEAGQIHNLPAIIHLANFFWVPLNSLMSNHANSIITAEYHNGKRSLATVKNNLSITMQKRKTTCKALSQKSGIAETTIKSYRTGRCMPSLSNLILLAEALGITVDSLIE